MTRIELLRKVRANNLLYWANKKGRKELAHAAGYDDANQINQLVTERGSFGPKIAGRFEIEQ